MYWNFVSAVNGKMGVKWNECNVIMLIRCTRQCMIKPDNMTLTAVSTKCNG